MHGAAPIIFPYELCGTTLLVSPHSELGSLRENEIHQELDVIMELLQRGPELRHIVLDFSGVTYLGTAMLGGIVKLWKKVCNRGGRMALCCVSAPVMDVLRVTKLHTVWPLHATREAAERSVQS